MNNNYDIKTIEYDEEFLRKKSNTVTQNDIKYLEELRILKDYCKKENCFAVSAIQLGIAKRIIYLNRNDKKSIDRVLINPKVLNQEGKTEYWEACLSIPNKIGLVERPYSMELEFYDENLKIHKEKFKNLDTTIISHELDHLDGILYTDKAKQILKMTPKEREKYRKEHSYRIINKK